MFFLLSIVCSAINETIAMALSWRATDLKNALVRMLGPENAQTVRASASADGNPAYVDPKLLSKTVLEILIDAGDKNAGGPLQRAEAGINAIQNAAVRKRLLRSIELADGNIAKFRIDVEDEFNALMDRVSGVYRRRVQTVLIVLAVIVTGIANADTFHVANTLWKNPELRTAVAAKANAISQGQRPASGDPATPTDCKTSPQECTTAAIQRTASDVNKVKELGLPLGWGKENRPPLELKPIVSKILGLLITAIALTMGAPFWFDTLGRLSRLRFAGNKPTESTTPASNEPNANVT